MRFSFGLCLVRNYMWTHVFTHAKGSHQGEKDSGVVPRSTSTDILDKEHIAYVMMKRYVCYYASKSFRRRSFNCFQI